MREVDDADGRVPRGDRRTRSLRGARRDRRDAPRVGRAAEDGDAPARRAPLLSVRHGGRAAPVRSVVREDGAARAPGAAGRARRRDPHSARTLGSGVRELAHQHPRLEHLAAAVVGSSRAGVVLRRMRSAAEHHREPRRHHASVRTAAVRCVRTRTCSTRGSRRGCGRSRRSAGRTRSRPISPRSIRPTRSSPPRRFSSSGWRA